MKYRYVRAVPSYRFREATERLPARIHVAKVTYITTKLPYDN